jgi:hypothetical protein
LAVTVTSKICMKGVKGVKAMKRSGFSGRMAG